MQFKEAADASEWLHMVIQIDAAVGRTDPTFRCYGSGFDHHQPRAAHGTGSEMDQMPIVPGSRCSMNTGTSATLQVTRAFIPVLETNKNGAIVNVLAVVSLVSSPGLGGYSASKAAAHSLTLGLRGELSKWGISVHGAYPGPIDTDMTRRIDRPKARASEVASATLDGVEAGQAYIPRTDVQAGIYEGWCKSHAEVESQFGASMIVPDTVLAPEALYFNTEKNRGSCAFFSRNAEIGRIKKAKPGPH